MSPSSSSLGQGRGARVAAWPGAGGAMASFDRMPSGIKGLDEALDSIRLGDNVVWQVSSLADFRPISDAFVRQSVADGRDAVYMRFASHPRLVARDTPGVKEVRLDPRKGFETFTMQVHRARGPRGLLRLRQPLRPAEGEVGRPHYGQLLPPHLPLPVLAGHRGVLPGDQGRALLRGHRQGPRHHAAAHRRLAGRAGPGRGRASSWGSARRPWTAQGATTPGS